MAEEEERERSTDTEERSRASGKTPTNLVIFKVSKAAGEALAVSDSQKRGGSWKRLPGRGTSQEREEQVNNMEEENEKEEPQAEEGLLMDTQVTRLAGEPSDNPGLKDDYATKVLSRPAEFTGSTPDRGNQSKKRVPDSRNLHKQLLFSQEIEATWREKLLEVGLVTQQEDRNPILAEEGNLSADICLPVAPLDGALEGATSQDESRLERTLRSILPGASVVVDYKENGDGDAVLLCHSSITVLESGISGKGFAAWMKVQTIVGPVGIVSLHAPNDSSARKEVWEWLKQLMMEGQWIIMGDFNMVERQEDSIGPSPVVRGDELYSWEICAGSADLVDTRLYATKVIGPHFTRQAWYGNRFDQSRLDRFYLSGRGEWVHHIRKVEHQGARTLSDHVPICMELVMKPEGAARRPRRSYFKMDFKSLMRPEVLERAKIAWQNHPSWAKDKRKRWTLALGRIRKLLMEVREEDSKKDVEFSSLETRVEEARMRIQNDNSVERREEFEEAVTTLRKKEQERADLCRRRCKITWLKEGDAPSKYFFARLRAKHANEEMTAIESNAGDILEDQVEILEEVQRFYQELYTAEEDTDEVLETRRKVVERIDRGLTTTDNRVLEEVPSEELITRIVMEMPREKSPGLDGVMVEILRIGWEFMKEDCFLMVQGFWDKKKLIGKDRKGVIKLIPKNERKHLLKNWRPITLLTMTYKIIAKVMAIRLKDMLPRIIDTQQTGFVAGRNIIDNILSLRLGQEWAQTTEQDVIFVKLDFMKAYDRVAHGFLWATLGAMGMGEASVTRIKGLVEGGSSEVHINGEFTEEISIGRGVRQGCPLAPLLFAMTTQPLMLALREEERLGHIQGLNIVGGKTLLHQLFADDTGICITAVENQFERLKEVIKEFECASGAALNLQKSIVMQLRPRITPTWLEQSGCEIAESGKSFLYLGVTTSSPINEKEIASEIVQKMMRKLKHWSNRLLSWPAKTILLKHVLAATPLYQLLSVGLCKDGLEALERLCRNFLWGWNEEGCPKQALIAWDRIAVPKEDGGLGWTRFRDMADALNVRQVSRIMEGGEAEWIQLAKSFILRALRRGSYQRECSQWTVEEALLLLPLTKVPGSPTLTRMLASWNKIRKRLNWKEEVGELDGSMSLLQVAILRQVAGGGGVKRLKDGKVLGILRRARISNLGEAVEISGTVGKTRRRREQILNLIEPGQRILTLLEWIDVALQKAQLNPASLLICVLYCWTVWREKNEWEFRAKYVHRPVRTILNEVALESSVLHTTSRTEERERASRNAEETANRWKAAWELQRPSRTGNSEQL
ncbi:hypothetical protein R1sor_022516 [Riccia sorocarpa]|uniref:Reverse transcriptase domain-containing protein n=1 Tax=Riccia sorocarpa TaxID=122646 RepID=A0ABD3GK19_9MARC